MDKTINAPYQIADEPFRSKWLMKICDGIYFAVPGDRNIPNRFHRAMLNLVFGFSWERNIGG